MSIVQTSAAPEAAPVIALAAPKVLFYSHDTFGLGNIRRTLLSQALAEEYPARRCSW